MKNLVLTSLAAGALASAALGLAGTATAVPSGPSPVDATVSQLRAQGRRIRYGNGHSINELLLQVQFSIGAHGAHSF